MVELFTLQNLFTLLMLILLQAVLGFDNLLYISMESKRVEEDQQQRVRRIGVGLAIGLRLVLLFVLLAAIESFQDPFLNLDAGKLFHASFNVHSVIVLFGGGFIIWTAVKEIFHMLAGDLSPESEAGARRTPGQAIFRIVAMNLIFSFDSILSALALTHEFWIMAAAIVVSGVLMIWLSDHVSAFLRKNRMYEVLGLFILLIVGVMLLSEGGHLAHLAFFGHDIEPMAKSTFYFVLAVLVIVDLVQSRFQRRLLGAQNRREAVVDAVS